MIAFIKMQKQNLECGKMDLLELVIAGKELDSSELVKLYDYDLFTLGSAANSIREKKYQKKVFFNMNRHINPTNICADVCKFCAFSASRKNPNPYEMTIEEIVSQVLNSYNRGAKEVHIVSAHSPNYPYEWYINCFKEVKKAAPKIHLKAMTAAEVYYLSKKFDKHHIKVLEDMINAGVDSMPGGGAEIFNEEIRKIICRDKVSSKNWLEIHKDWHKMGKMSNATMLFGHIESREHRIEHMLLLKKAQTDSQIVESKNGGFNAFIPLLFQRDNNFLKINSLTSGQEILKTIAISRIILRNFPHIKAYWATLGMNLALVAQEFGADDMDGTIENESIQSAGGSKSKNGASKENLIAYIKDAGFRPIERDSLYNELVEY